MTDTPISQPDKAAKAALSNPTGPVSEGVLIERLRDLNQHHPDADVLPFKEAADTIARLASPKTVPDGTINSALAEAARNLLADVRRRYPGEELRCEYMRALDAALATPPEQDRSTSNGERA